MGRPTLILASRSPRRAALLRAAGWSFLQADPPFEDPLSPSAGAGEAEQVARDLAVQKGVSLLSHEAVLLAEDPLVIAADTVVIDPQGRLVGTPADREEAQAMLRGFLGRRHAVVTGVALLRPARQQMVSFTDRAQVAMGPVAEEEIERYLDSAAWRDKAGGYNLFDRQAAGWPITVEGDPTTVVGLPMAELTRRLAAWGIAADDTVSR